MKISQRIKMAAVAVAMVFVGTMAVVPAYAEDYTCPTGSKRAGEVVKSATLCNVPKDEDNKDLMSILRTILNVVFGIIGFLAVVMLVYGGIQYTISAGDSGKVKKAKDTILYGVVGLVVALLAAAIVNFVLTSVL